MLGKAQGLPADQVFLDLEDSVAPLAKESARANIVAALNEGDWAGKTRVVRVNDLTTQWTYRDVIEVVEGAGANLDCLMLPKVQIAAQVRLARPAAHPDREDASGSRSAASASRRRSRTRAGLVNVDAIAAASPRVETIIFGPADFMASINMRSLVVGEQPPGYDVGRRLPLHPDAHPDGRAHARPAGDRRPVPADQGRRRLPAGGRPVGRARLRRQVGAAPRPDRRGQRGLLAGPGRLRPRRADPRRLRLLHVRGRRACAARSCSATR